MVDALSFFKLTSCSNPTSGGWVLTMIEWDGISYDISLFQIKDIKEDVDYYVESNHEDDFEENEFIYDDLVMEEG